jgi:hypothetical protein
VKCVTRSRAVALIVLAVATVGCKRSSSAADPLAASLIFDNGSPEAREALATAVDFRLTEENFARWEQAQSNLEHLPRSAIQSGVPSGRSAIDRAVNRLESSPTARRAIERAGLSVRDFVLETIALAQASEVVETGKSTSATPIPQDNFQFVQRYRGRVLLARREDRLAREQAEAFDMHVDTSENSNPGMNTQMDERDGEHAAEMRSGDDTAGKQDTTHDSARDTVPLPRMSWAPEQGTESFIAGNKSKFRRTSRAPFGPSSPRPRSSLVRGQLTSLRPPCSQLRAAASSSPKVRALFGDGFVRCVSHRGVDRLPWTGSTGFALSDALHPNRA